MKHQHQSDSAFTHKEACPKCGSRDNLARYTDGHGWCFGCGHYEPASDTQQSPTRSPRMSPDWSPVPGDVSALPARRITEETCRHFGYLVGADPVSGKPIQLAPYCDSSGQVVAQKWRSASKDFGVFGKLKEALPLFGQHLWRDGGKKVVITEGEIDCLTVSQLQGNKWPVVSVPNGAQGAKKSLSAALEWLEKFDEVILMFDQDQPGRDAVEECAPLFTPGRCKVASLPLKDPNEMLKAGRGDEVISAIWGAKAYRPDGIVSVDDVAEEAKADPIVGMPWFLEALTDLTYGRRPGDLYGFGAGTGIGKTDFFTQSIAFDLDTLKLQVGLLYLEQPAVETVRRVAGKVAKKVLHVPGEATMEERSAAIDHLKNLQALHLYNSQGCADWDTVKGKIRYMVVSLGCKVIYLDHLTALVAGEEDERKALDLIMAELAALALELGVVIHYISHLTRPKEGPPHEEGGRVKQAHFRGSNAIGMWSHFIFGLERHQQHEDPEVASTTTLRCLKDRNTGRATGKLLYLGYEASTGLLYLRDKPGESSPFTDQTATATAATKQEF